METALLLAGGIVAALVSGMTGFGFAVVASALWSHAVAPQKVTVLVLVLQFALNVAYLPFLWREIALRRLWPLLLGAVGGVPLGAWMLRHAEVDPMRLGLGVFLLAWSLWMLSRGQLPHLRLSPRAGRAADAGVGVASGALGALAGLSGVLPAIWCAMRAGPDGDKAAHRGILQGFILFTSVTSLAWVGGLVGVDQATVVQLAWLLPVVVAAGLVGLKVFSRLPGQRVVQLTLWTVALCGALLVWRAGRSLLQ